VCFENANQSPGTIENRRFSVILYAAGLDGLGENNTDWQAVGTRTVQ
jgi:hypothetical protein